MDDFDWRDRIAALATELHTNAAKSGGAAQHLTPLVLCISVVTATEAANRGEWELVNEMADDLALLADAVKTLATQTRTQLDIEWDELRVDRLAGRLIRGTSN